MSKAETRAFKVHPQLLFDVIQRQAGTLTKALCEGVMNSIDAGSSEVAVTIADDHATITDDGKGFASRQEIELFFETFGQPHKAGDAVYGTFRMGRGQMFSFGKNKWRSGRFEMSVDIKGRGLDYDLTETKDDFKGCAIRIDLYRALTMLQRSEIADELRRFVRYVPVPVKVNGDVINKNPANEKWDYVDEDAYYKFAQGRLSLYNLGVFVNDSRAYSLGIGGVVVTKKQIRLNFARNDVLADECEVWKRIAKVLRSKADKHIDQKRSALNAEERALLARKLRAGELSGEAARDAAVFQDCTGRWLSIAKLTSMAYGYGHKITSGPKGPKAEKVQRAKMAIALNSDLFDEFFSVDDLDELIKKVIKPNVAHWNLKVTPLDSLVPDYDERREIIPPKEWMPNEEIVMAVCAELSPPDFSNERKIVLGNSDDALGWTDGKTFIAIARQFLKGRNVASPSTWTAIALLLCHEYCHADASTSPTHVHSPEFYEGFHDRSDDAVTMWVEQALKAVRVVVAKMKMKVNKNALRWLDNIAAANVAAGQLGVAIAAKKTVIQIEKKPAPMALAAKAAPLTTGKQSANGYGSILAARGFERQPSAKGTQVWTRAADGWRCDVATKPGVWRLHMAVGKTEQGRLTPSLAALLIKLEG